MSHYLHLILVLLLSNFQPCLATPLDTESPKGTGLSLKIEPVESKVHNQIKATFSNLGATDLSLLRPIDGSMHAWLKPYYSIIITDLEGEIQSLPSRCKHCGISLKSKWSDYTVTLKSGESWSIILTLPHRVAKNGEYNLTMQYVYNKKDSPRTPMMEKLYPEGIWIGKVVSKPLTLKLNKR